VAERDELARRAGPVLALFVATLAAGLLLLVLFDPDVQTLDASELAERRDEAREFLVADYVFVLLYAVASPIAIWRFGAALVGGTPPVWVRAAALALVAAGVCDAVQNALLFAASGSESQSAVDVAHAVSVPLMVLFIVGALLALAVNVRAVRALRRGAA
jgi:hypothetical protein